MMLLSATTAHTAGYTHRKHHGAVLNEAGTYYRHHPHYWHHRWHWHRESNAKRSGKAVGTMVQKAHRWQERIVHSAAKESIESALAQRDIIEETHGC